MASGRRIGWQICSAAKAFLPPHPGTEAFVDSFDVAWTFIGLTALTALTALAAGALVFLAYRRPPDAPSPPTDRRCPAGR